jgi:ketosteroid isomerase-like protein
MTQENLPQNAGEDSDDALDVVRWWFSELARYCASREFERARSLMDDNVVSFGTKARAATGLNQLSRDQWKSVWEYIEDFKIDLASIRGGGSGSVAWGASRWTSTGFDANGRPFHRPGRATVVLERKNDRWTAIHTHFSLDPGTPQETYGRPKR